VKNVTRRAIIACAALAALLSAPAAAETTVKRELAHARQAEGDSEKIPDEAFPEVVEVLEEIYFAPESARLSAEARTALDAVAARWRGRDAEDGVFLEIRGHSDGSGNWTNNLSLARRRAEAVVRYLRERGIPSERLVALALGPSDPIGNESTPEGRAQNRRAEIVAVGTRPAVE
jgi:outer membrane protein OmpA-like peptidoglycan-associated protein